MASWELIILVLSSSVASGGYSGFLWGFIVTSLLYAPVVLSLAEMESMAPTSGGQYHWVSEFSPPKYQKQLSYASGWMLTLSWLATQTAGPFLTVTLINTLINVTNPDYSFTSWQYTLIMLAVIASTILFNTWAATILPAIEAFALYIHVLGFFIVIISLWVCGPKGTAKEVFITFTAENGWNLGAALLLTQVNSFYCILGSVLRPRLGDQDEYRRKRITGLGRTTFFVVDVYIETSTHVIRSVVNTRPVFQHSDTAVHISEEVKDAGTVVPRCMWWSYVLNFVMALVTLITMLFTWGPIDDALNADTPYLILFQNIPVGVALLMLIVIFILIYIGNVTTLVTVSRQTWAFARDRGFPFSKWITKMDHKRALPFNSVYLTSVLSGVLCLINLGSTLAFNIIVSLSLLALLSTYTMSVGCIFWRRPTNQPLPPARWSLGKWGIWINGAGFAYSIFAMIWCCFPTTLPVDASSANYGPAIWGGVILLAVVMYIFHGRKHYTPPVDFVEGRRNPSVGIQHI